jgi:hypothetical protein
MVMYGRHIFQLLTAIKVTRVVEVDQIFRN